MAVNGNVEVGGLTYQTAVGNLFVSGTLTTSGSLQLGQSITDTSGDLVLSASTGLISVSGTLELNSPKQAHVFSKNSDLIFSSSTGIVTVSSSLHLNQNAFLYTPGKSTSSFINDTNVPVQISTTTANSEAYYGANKNGAYGFLLGYSNTTLGSWPLGGLMRMVTTDNFSFVMNSNTLSFTVNSLGQISNVIRVPSAKTSNYVALLSESYTSFHNKNAVGIITQTLPPSTLGVNYTYTTTAAQSIVINTLTGSIFGPSLTGTSRTLSASIGNSITVACLDGTNWYITSIVGTVT